MIFSFKPFFYVSPSVSHVGVGKTVDLVPYTHTRGSTAVVVSGFTGKFHMESTGHPLDDYVWTERVDNKIAVCTNLYKMSDVLLQNWFFFSTFGCEREKTIYFVLKNCLHLIVLADALISINSSASPKWY